MKPNYKTCVRDEVQDIPTQTHLAPKIAWACLLPPPNNSIVCLVLMRFLFIAGILFIAAAAADSSPRLLPSLIQGCY